MLDVAPGYLMCLTDDRQVTQEFPWLGALIPLLNAQQACDPKTVNQAIRDEREHDSISFIPLSPSLSQQLGQNAFALHMQDDSMMPEINIGDVLIVDPDEAIRPGKLVVVHFQDSKEATVRRYKQLSTDSSIGGYELLSTNENWGNIRVTPSCGHKTVGVILAFIRVL